jgi:hypothetical protein
MYLMRRGDNMTETEKKETPPQSTQTHATSQGQYIPDKTLRRVCLESQNRPEEKKE